MSASSKQPSYSQLVQDATLLARKIKEDTEVLDSMKARLRDEAQRRRVGDGLVEFESKLGVATVCFVKDSVVLVKGADPKTLIDVIPDVSWSALFDTKVVLNREFEAKLVLERTGVQSRVRRLVEWVSNAPRVTLPK